MSIIIDIFRSGGRQIEAIAAILVLLSAGMASATEPVADPPQTTSRPLAQPLARPLARPLITALADAAAADGPLAEPGIVFAQAMPNHAELSSRCVVLIPGLLAREQSMAALLAPLESKQYVTGMLRYSSHQGIKSAAELLAAQLRSLKTSHPQCQVALVTHSMGGLVARHCLEHPATNPGNVSDLIMIAPPNHGSAVAGLSAAQLVTSFSPFHLDGAAGAQTLDEVMAGLVGNPLEELKIDSPLLGELNACPRAAGVRYTVIAGSGGPVSRGLVGASLLLGELLVAEDPQTKAALKSARSLAGLDEWTQGRGDGVVSIQSAKLDGVGEIVVLPFAHNDFGDRTSKATGEVVAEVLKRLEPR